jgi:hypothetical protein
MAKARVQPASPAPVAGIVFGSIPKPILASFLRPSEFRENENENEKDFTTNGSRSQGSNSHNLGATTS